jgi:hypothetical protein
MRWLGLTLLLFCSRDAPVLAQDAPAARITASVRRVFGEGARADTTLVHGITVLRIALGDSLQGFALVRDVKGKDLPITFLVAVDPSGVVRDVDILVYREPYGGEVAYENWRRQFRGAGADNPLRVGREIRGISGATISVHAVTLGVRAALDSLQAWRSTGALR